MMKNKKINKGIGIFKIISIIIGIFWIVYSVIILTTYDEQLNFLESILLISLPILSILVAIFYLSMLQTRINAKIDRIYGNRSDLHFGRFLEAISKKDFDKAYFIFNFITSNKIMISNQRKFFMVGALVTEGLFFDHLRINSLNHIATLRLKLDKNIRND